MVIVWAVAVVAMLGLVVRALLVPPLMETLAESLTTTRYAWTPPIPLEPEELEAAKPELDDFVERVKNETFEMPLRHVLTAPQLNALLEEASIDADRDWRLTLTIINGNITGVVSVRLDRDMASGIFAPFEGRYLNGTANFDLSYRGGDLVFAITSLIVQTRSAPQWLLRRLNEKMGLGEALDDPDLAPFFANLTAVEVVGDEVVLTALPARVE